MEMAAADADRSVRVATITLLETIRQRDLLDPDDIDKISLMIFDPEARIRKAAASSFLADVDALYEETCEEIGGSVEAVEEELGDDRESGDGVPFTWLKFNALVKTLAKYDTLVDEAEKENSEDESGRAPFKAFELGQVESRIPMAASSIIAEMDELQVFPLTCGDSDNVRTGIIWLAIYCAIIRYDPKSEVKPGVSSQKQGKPVP